MTGLSNADARGRQVCRIRKNGNLAIRLGCIPGVAAWCVHVGVRCFLQQVHRLGRNPDRGQLADNRRSGRKHRRVGRQPFASRGGHTVRPNQPGTDRQIIRQIIGQGTFQTV